MDEFLSSWNHGPSKKAILNFVNRITKDGADFIPIEDRVAVFDNDGTLWCEKPLYTQFFFALDQISKLSTKHPEWKQLEPFKSILDGDVKSVLAGGKKSIAAINAATHAGMTTDEFNESANKWMKTAVNSQMNRPFKELVYQPMLELLDYLKAYDFKIYIVSAGGADFMRATTIDLYGISPSQIIGSSGKTKFIKRDGKAVLIKLPEVDSIDEGEGKPSNIHKFIGQRPILAFGNSDGDSEMLEWVSLQDRPSLSLLLHHTDADREWAYDTDSHVGKLDRGLKEAKKLGWVVVDMKKDWNIIFPFQKFDYESISSTFSSFH